MPSPIENHAETLSALMRDRLGIKGPSLARQVHKAGRLLPRRIRREAKRVLEAQTRAHHPKLARTVDPGEVARSAEVVAEYLRGIDPAERRKDRILWALGKASAFLIVVFIVMVWLAWDRGLI